MFIISKYIDMAWECFNTLTILYVTTGDDSVVCGVA